MCTVNPRAKSLRLDHQAISKHEYLANYILADSNMHVALYDGMHKDKNKVNAWGAQSIILIKQAKRLYSQFLSTQPLV